MFEIGRKQVYQEEKKRLEGNKFKFDQTFIVVNHCAECSSVGLSCPNRNPNLAALLLLFVLVVSLHSNPLTITTTSTLDMLVIPFLASTPSMLSRFGNHVHQQVPIIGFRLLVVSAPHRTAGTPSNTTSLSSEQDPPAYRRRYVWSKCAAKTTPIYPCASSRKVLKLVCISSSSLFRLILLI